MCTYMYDIVHAYNMCDSSSKEARTYILRIP